MYSNIDVIRSNVLVGLTSGRNYQLLPEVDPPVESPSNMLVWRNINIRLKRRRFRSVGNILTKDFCQIGPPFGQFSKNFWTTNSMVFYTELFFLRNSFRTFSWRAPLRELLWPKIYNILQSYIYNHLDKLHTW